MQAQRINIALHKIFAIGKGIEIAIGTTGLAKWYMNVKMFDCMCCHGSIVVRFLALRHAVFEHL